MAIRWKRTQPQTQAFAMAPMVDMVFLLLVFFMCVTAVSGGRARIQVALPQTHTAGAAGVQAQAGVQVVLSVSAGGALSLNGQPCEESQLVPQLRQMRAQAGEGLGVRIRADANVPYSRIEPLLRACSAAGISKISYAAHEATLAQTALGGAAVVAASDAFASAVASVSLSPMAAVVPAAPSASAAFAPVMANGNGGMK